MSLCPVRGIIFDLDGTLVDSALDFDQMRCEMDLPPGTPILEALEKMPLERAERCRAILARHEEAGARRATLMPGVAELLAELDRRRLRRAILTRNTRHLAHEVLERFGLQFDPILAREDAPAKPDPAGLLHVCEAWNLTPAEVVMVGDYRFDIEAGRAAGMRTILYTRRRPATGLPGAELADFHLECFSRAGELLEELCGGS